MQKRLVMKYNTKRNQNVLQKYRLNIWLKLILTEFFIDIHWMSIESANFCPGFNVDDEMVTEMCAMIPYRKRGVKYWIHYFINENVRLTLHKHQVNLRYWLTITYKKTKLDVNFIKLQLTIFAYFVGNMSCSGSRNMWIISSKMT